MKGEFVLSIFTNIRKTLSRQRLREDEERIKSDLLHKNEDKLLDDVSQRTGILINSGLSQAEKEYILSDSIVSAAIQLYMADVKSICDKDKCIIASTTPYTDENGDISKKEERVKFIFNQIFSTELIENIILSLLTNGEIFLVTKYNQGLNQCFVNETSYSHVVELCYESGQTACFIATNEVNAEQNRYAYNYNLFNGDRRGELVEPDKMVRIYTPTLSNTKTCIELEDDDDDNFNGANNFGKNQKWFSPSGLNTSKNGQKPYDLSLSTIAKGNYLYCTGSLSLLKQIYPDWLNGKLLELAVYRNRIARSRFIQLIALELGRTSKQTSDQIYDNVKDYFDKRAVIDLEQQTFKSVVGDEPFTDYKVYITRNGNGQLTFDNSLNGQSTDVNALADLDYNQNKLYAGIGIPKQYLGGDDNGSALSNGSSLFFLDEKYQKRILAYIGRIQEGLKQAIKNIILQSEEEDKKSQFFYDFDFTLKFQIPENNQDVMQVKTAKLDYTKSLLELIDTVVQNASKYSVDALTAVLGEDLRKLSTNLAEVESEGGAPAEGSEEEV